MCFGNVSNKGVLPGDLGTRTGFAAGAPVGLGAGIIAVGAEALFAPSTVASPLVMTGCLTAVLMSWIGSQASA